MKISTGLTFLLCLTTTSLFAEKPKDSAVTVLYDGGDLSGWKGRSDLWSAEDGQIVGRTTAEKPIKGNTFLIWKGGTPDDFELTAQFKIESGNSGIQYRSRVVNEKDFVVSGYQADIDFGNRFAGILYEEKGRGIRNRSHDFNRITQVNLKVKRRTGDLVIFAKAKAPDFAL